LLTAWAKTITPAMRYTARRIDMSVLISLFSMRFFISCQLSFSQQKIKKFKKYLINFFAKSLRIIKN
jgi:hypothetical protein